MKISSTGFLNAVTVNLKWNCCNIQKEALRKALQTLNEGERRLIHMRYYLEMTQEEIAELIGKTQQSISYEIGAVLNKLHKFLKN